MLGFVTSSMGAAMLTAVALGVTCAILSVFVVLRRWAFIGEGISHSGFGGAGVAWMLAVLAPGIFGAEQTPWMVSTCVVLFCLGTAALIGYFSLHGEMNFDAVVGIFLVASLAFGFTAQHVYMHMEGRQPWGFDSVFLGDLLRITPAYSLAALGICAAVVLTVVALWKEIVSYCFDPLGAHVGGMRAGVVHFVLMLLVAVTIIIGMYVAGALLVTALIVLPGATALLLGRQMRGVMTLAIITGLIGTVGGTLIHEWLRFIPAGPAIALVLFVEFVVAYVAARVLRLTA